jgi:ATP-binding cassette subfamily B protein
MSKNEYEIGQMKDKQRPMGPGGGPPHLRMAEKPKDFKKSMSKLLAFSKKYWPAYIIAICFAIAGSIMTLIGPDKMKDITDIIYNGAVSALMGSGKIDLDKIAGICLTLVVIYASGAIFSFIQGWTLATVSQKLTKGLRRGISEKINRLPLRYFDNTTFGNIISRVTNDIDTLGMSLNQALSQLVTAVTMILGAIVMMLVTDWHMALTAVASTFIGFFVMSSILKSSQKFFKRNQKHLGEINGHIEEIYAGHNIVKAFNGEKEARKTFEAINEKLYESNWKSQFFSGLMPPLMSFIGNFGYVAICVVGALLVKNGTITFGVIAAFLMYIRLFTQPLAQITQAAT